MLDSVWDVAHTVLRPVVGGAVGVVMAQHAQANSAATIAAAAVGGGAALASHVVKTSMRIGVNASPEPFSNIVASLLKDLGVIGLEWFAVFHPVAAAAVAAVVLAVGFALFALLASRIRQSLAPPTRWSPAAAILRRSCGRRWALAAIPRRHAARRPRHGDQTSNQQVTHALETSTARRGRGPSC